MRRLALGLLAFFSMISVAAAQEGQGGDDLAPPSPEEPATPAYEAPPADEPPPPPPPGTQQEPSPPPSYGQQTQQPSYPQGPPPPHPMDPGDPLVGPDEDPNDPRFMDANVDRVLLFSTAETHPEGTFYFSDYQLIFLQFGYAFTDNIQATLTGVPPLVEDQPYFFDLSLKANLLRGPFRFALIGSLDVLFNVDSRTDWLAGGRGGAVGTVCFGESCWSHLSMGATALFSNESTDLLPFLLNLGLVARVSELVAFLVEPVFLGVVGDETELTNAMLLSYGIRLSGRHWGVDLGLMKVIPFEGGTDDPFILGWPLVSFTYRTEWTPRGGGMAPPPMGGGQSSAVDMTRRALTGF